MKRWIPSLWASVQTDAPSGTLGLTRRVPYRLYLFRFFTNAPTEHETAAPLDKQYQNGTDTGILRTSSRQDLTRALYFTCYLQVASVSPAGYGVWRGMES